MRVIQPVFAVKIDASTSPLSSSSYSVINAALPGPVKELEIFDSTGRVLQLYEGKAGAERALPFYVFPGGNPKVAVTLPAGTRLTVLSTDTSATAGLVIINGYR